ncbi:MAG: WYL domain-containing protein [Paludibacteraceae bacterium]|nr:WYL domain-containing protein [Paludibacteraceae bacterium]
MALTTFKRYIWLISTVQNGNGLTFKEIGEKWQESPLNDTGEEFPRRTFIAHKDAILDLFGIEIRCRKGKGARYYIDSSDDLYQNSHLNWMINSFAVNNMLQEGYQLKNRIIFEEIPSGHKFLTCIIEAMQSSARVEIAYQKFGDMEPSIRVLDPYCLKVDKQRWYLLARSQDDKLKIYALDRIHNVTILEEKFDFPESFSVTDYFKDSVGVYVDDSKVERVRLRAWGKAINYLRTLPLHHTQVEYEISNNESIFELNAKSDYQLQQELYKYGSEIVVLEPRSLQQKMLKTAEIVLKETKAAMDDC